MTMSESQPDMFPMLRSSARGIIVPEPCHNVATCVVIFLPSLVRDIVPGWTLLSPCRLTLSAKICRSKSWRSFAGCSSSIWFIVLIHAFSVL